MQNRSGVIVFCIRSSKTLEIPSFTSNSILIFTPWEVNLHNQHVSNVALKKMRGSIIEVWQCDKGEVWQPIVLSSSVHAERQRHQSVCGNVAKQRVIMHYSMALFRQLCNSSQTHANKLSKMGGYPKYPKITFLDILSVFSWILAVPLLLDKPMQRVLQALKRQRVGDQEPSIKAEVDASRTSSPWDKLFLQVKYHLVIFHSSPWKITIFKNGKPSLYNYKLL